MEPSNRNGNLSPGEAAPVGDKIGKYEIRQTIGQPGQARAYKCYDPLLDREVAIKEIPSEVAKDEHFVEKLRREAQKLARVGSEHDAITTVYDVVSEGGRAFVVMELAEGVSLEKILTESGGPIQPGEVVRIIWRVAATLIAVHKAGIIHGNIKPANVIIADGPKVKITDFGTVLTTSEQTEPPSATARYMAPEAFEGRKMDCRADIYSLGLMAYEMLVGRKAYDKLFAGVVSDRPAQPRRWRQWQTDSAQSLPPLGQINAAVPARLCEVIAGMISKDPSGRFASMEDLARAIRQDFAAEITGQDNQQIIAEGTAQPAMPDRSELVESDTVSVDEPSSLSAASADSTMRLRFVLAGLGILAILSAGLLAGKGILVSQQRRIDAAEKLYAPAADHYSNGRYPEAAEGFSQVVAGFGGTSQAIKASVLVHLAGARDAIQRDDFALSQRALGEAQTQLEQVQTEHRYLASWSQSTAADLTSARESRLAALVLFEAISAAKTEATAGRYGQAQQILDSRLKNFTPTAQQAARLSRFAGELLAGRFLAECNAQLSDAEKSTSEGNFEQAEATYQNVRRKLASSDAAALPDASRSEIEARLTLALAATASQRVYSENIAVASAAREAGDDKAELAALEAAGQAKSVGSDVAYRIRQLKIALAMAEGKGLMKIGETARAIEKFSQAVAMNATDEAAAGELANARAMLKWQEIVTSGNVDFDVGNTAEALEKYQRAAQIRPDRQVDERILECRFSLGLSKAEAMVAAEKFTEALAAYESLRQIRPERSDQIDAWQNSVRVLQQYAAHISAGDQAVIERRWGDAIRNYRKAKAIKSSKEVEDRIINARYTENLTKGTEAMSVGDMDSARGYFGIAKTYMDTEEINKLLERVLEAQE